MPTPSTPTHSLPTPPPFFSTTQQTMRLFATTTSLFLAATLATAVDMTIAPEVRTRAFPQPPPHDTLPRTPTPSPHTLTPPSTPAKQGSALRGVSDKVPVTFTNPTVAGPTLPVVAAPIKQGAWGEEKDPDNAAPAASDKRPVTITYPTVSGPAMPTGGKQWAGEEETEDKKLPRAADKQWAGEEHEEDAKLPRAGDKQWAGEERETLPRAADKQWAGEEREEEGPMDVNKQWAAEEEAKLPRATGDKVPVTITNPGVNAGGVPVNTNGVPVVAPAVVNKAAWAGEAEEEENINKDKAAWAGEEEEEGAATRGDKAAWAGEEEEVEITNKDKAAWAGEEDAMYTGDKAAFAGLDDQTRLAVNTVRAGKKAAVLLPSPALKTAAFKMAQDLAAADSKDLDLKIGGTTGLERAKAAGYAGSMVKPVVLSEDAGRAATDVEGATLAQIGGMTASKDAFAGVVDPMYKEMGSGGYLSASGRAYYVTLLGM